jgi:hypothetical protein
MLRFTIASTSASAAVAGHQTSRVLNAPGTIKPHRDHTGIESAYDFSRSFDRHSRAARPIWVQSEREMQ